MSKVAFIGVGYMGYGMAKNLLKKHQLFVFAHKNRKPITRLLKAGAKELKIYKELKENNIKKNDLKKLVEENKVDLSILKNYSRKYLEPIIKKFTPTSSYRTYLLEFAKDDISFDIDFYLRITF